MTPTRHIHPASIARQQGVAVVTALLLTALAVTIVAGLFWQQQVQTRLVENQQVRLRQQWMMRDLLDWARLILTEDERTSTIDHTGEAWAQPLSAKDLADAPGAVLSGTIVDAQGLFNLNNLSSAGQPNAIEIATFERLLIQQRLNGQLAKVAADTIAAVQRSDTGDIDQTRMQIWQLDDLLTAPGFTPEIIERLREFVVVLPSTTSVDVNTAPAPILAALFPAMTVQDAAQLVEDRRRAAYRDLADFTERLKVRNLPLPRNQIAFNSRFFLVRCRVTVNDAELQSQSLIERNAGQTTVIWSREEQPWER